MNPIKKDIEILRKINIACFFSALLVILISLFFINKEIFRIGYDIPGGEIDFIGFLGQHQSVIAIFLSISFPFA